MSKSTAEIKKKILEPLYIRLHGGNVEYYLKDIHEQAGEVRSDRY